VRDAWDKVTNPGNLLALESLFYQLPEGPQMEMSRKALQVCRDRTARTPPEDDSTRRKGATPERWWLSHARRRYGHCGTSDAQTLLIKHGFLFGFEQEQFLPILVNVNPARFAFV
jgi:hypothetical protein